MERLKDLIFRIILPTQIIKANNRFSFSRDYKKEYDRLRVEKQKEVKKAEEDKLKAIVVKDAMGKEVPMSSMIEEVSAGRELTDIYLKHPGNESSDDEEGDEDDQVKFGDDEVDEQNFNDFIERRKASQQEKKSK